ncbi:MAG: PEP-CTERM sorting domain-containing protein [Planctomycetota bacterium]
MKSCIILAAGCLFILTNHCHADLVSMSDPVFGADSITLDTETGLQWLDLTQTAGLTIADVQAQQSPGQLFEGFNVASTSEMQTVISNGGWEFAYNTNFFNDAAKYSVAFELTETFGQTFTNPDSRVITFGWVSDTNTIGENYYNQIFARGSDFSSSAYVNTFTWPSARSDIGVWLYRTSIPEPASGLVLSASLVFASISRRRRTN